jgi:uncharacterized protein
MKYIIVGALVLFFAGCESKEEEIKQNSIEQIIIDEAYVVLDKPEVMKQYRDFNQHLLDSFDIDFRTITTTTNEDIDLFANSKFNKLQQKSRSQTGKAILMVINTSQDKVRLEVSMALEPMYTDAFISYIERKGFVPYFRNDTIADAIYMAASLISDRANDAKNGKEFMPQMQSKSIGAGAKTEALIGKKNYDKKEGVNVISLTTDTPIDILKKYLSSVKAHNTNPNLDIYTETTKSFFAGHTVTEINQNNGVRFLAPCMDSKQVKYASDGNHAVLMNDPVNQRTCTPHFFKKEQGLWKLDIATMAKVFRFNTTMMWHFDMDSKYEFTDNYDFAFKGLYFDNNGYPHIYVKKKSTPKYRWGYTCYAFYRPDDPNKTLRCGISIAYRGSPASENLGFIGRDTVIAVGEGAEKINDVSFDDFMDYMNTMPTSKKAIVTVKRDSGEVKVLHALAP